MFITTSTTASTYTPRHEDEIISDFLEYVYDSKSESDAINNIQVILLQHNRTLTFWQLLKLMFNK